MSKNHKYIVKTEDMAGGLNAITLLKFIDGSYDKKFAESFCLYN